MKISINYSEGILCLPLDVLDKIESMKESELKLLLYICRESGRTVSDFKSEAAATALGFSKNEVESALAFLRGAGFIKTSGKDAPPKASQAMEKASTQRADEPKVTVISNSPPQYSGTDLDKLLGEKKALGRLRAECESDHLFNRPLRPAELNMLVTMYDYLGLDEAYILQILSMSKDKSQPIKYAYTTAASYYEKNIVTYEALLEQIARDEEKNTFGARIKKLFGIDQRALTAKEKRFFEEWTKYDFELVKYAFERTVDNTGKASMPYMNTILTSFEEKGIHSVEEAEMQYKKHKEESKNAKTGGFDEKDFFEIALDSSYKKSQSKK